MSAFLVEPKHIAEIVKYAHNKKFGFAYNCFNKEKIDCDPKNMVKLLAQANIDSLVARYGEDPKDYADYVNECLDLLKYATDGIGISLLTGVGYCDLGSDDIYNMLACWNYQACEVDNWFETDAYWLGVYLKDFAAKKMATNANVQWSYDGAVA
mgnify:FL=1